MHGSWTYIFIAQLENLSQRFSSLIKSSGTNTKISTPFLFNINKNSDWDNVVQKGHQLKILLQPSNEISNSKMDQIKACGRHL